MTAGAAGMARVGRVRTWWLLLALALGPAGWIAQLTADYGLAGYACFAGHGQRTAPLLASSETLLLLAINLLGLAATVVGALIGYRAWRAAARGEGTGRNRFLASCALIASIGFAGAILFDTAEPLMTRACWTIGP